MSQEDKKLFVRGYWSGPVVLVNMPRGGQKAFFIEGDYAPVMKTPVLVIFDQGMNAMIVTCGTQQMLEVAFDEDYPVDYGKL